MNALCGVRYQGNEAWLNFYLTNFTDVQSLRTAINNIRYLDENTNTTGGLRLMRTEIFNAANGDRPDVPNVAILITDGNPTRDVPQLPGEVATIKNLGIRIIGVGVTNEVSSQHLGLCPSRRLADKLYEVCNRSQTHFDESVRRHRPPEGQLFLTTDHSRKLIRYA